MKKPKIKHTYEIDQSGKLEYTSHDTVLAISNGKSFSVALKAADKRLLQKMYRKLFNKNRQFVYEVFSALVYILLHQVKPNNQVTIDKEYPGKEALIKLHVIEYDKSKQKDLKEIINFGLVGKKSPAHKLGYLTFKKQKKPDKIISVEEIVKIIFPSKKTGYSSISGTRGS